MGNVNFSIIVIDKYTLYVAYEEFVYEQPSQSSGQNIRNKTSFMEWSNWIHTQTYISNSQKSPSHKTTVIGQLASC